MALKGSDSSRLDSIKSAFGHIFGHPVSEGNHLDILIFIPKPLVQLLIVTGQDDGMDVWQLVQRLVKESRRGIKPRPPPMISSSCASSVRRMAGRKRPLTGIPVTAIRHGSTF